MIVVKLMGGLGNQMFQYALGRNLALKLNTDLFLDLSSFEQHNGVDTPRHFELNLFNANYSLCTPELLSQFIPRHEGRITKIFHRLFGNAKDKNVIREPHFRYIDTLLSSANNSYLIGYWQSEKYFCAIKTTLLEDFTFKTPLQATNERIAQDIRTSESVSIHVRRGDYVNSKSANEFHGVCSLDYYKEALKTIVDKHNSPQLFVFSDDIDWAKQNLQFDFQTQYIGHNSGKNSFEDMRLMALCKHNIIANSSFSWWGAWLNLNPEKIVIAPKQWFADAAIDTSDLIPETWIKL